MSVRTDVTADTASATRRPGLQQPVRNNHDVLNLVYTINNTMLRQDSFCGWLFGCNRPHRFTI